jgi:hypothetical protein
MSRISRTMSRISMMPMLGEHQDDEDRDGRCDERGHEDDLKRRHAASLGCSCCTR